MEATSKSKNSVNSENNSANSEKLKARRRKNKVKSRIKLAVNIAMSAALLFLMSYQIYGGAAHEIVGCVTFALFVAHHALNARWHKNIARGKYTAKRTLILIVDILVFLCMILAMASGIAMSEYVFAGAADALSALAFHMRPSTARMVHMVSTHWGYLLVAVHLGLHFNAMRLATKSKSARAGEENVALTRANEASAAHTHKKRTAQIALFAAGALISVWGVWAFVSRNFAQFLFYKRHFAFGTEGENPLLFYIDYAAIAILCIFIVQCVMALVEFAKSRKSQPSRKNF